MESLCAGLKCSAICKSGKKNEGRLTFYHSCLAGRAACSAYSRLVGSGQQRSRTSVCCKRLGRYEKTEKLSWRTEEVVKVGDCFV